MLSRAVTEEKAGVIVMLVISPGMRMRRSATKR